MRSGAADPPPPKQSKGVPSRSEEPPPRSQADDPRGPRRRPGVLPAHDIEVRRDHRRFDERHGEHGIRHEADEGNCAQESGATHPTYECRPGESGYRSNRHGDGHDDPQWGGIVGDPMGQVGGDVRRKAMTDDGWQDQPGHERGQGEQFQACLLYTSPSPRDRTRSRMPSSA